MEGGKPRGEERWPVPEREARPALPTPEELPLVERGYDPDRVREAFDAFYRHIGRLDATLRAIEAVEIFRDQAGELRKELRALRSAGWTQQPWPSSSEWRPVSPGLPEALPRVALEAAFLIVVAVVAAVAGFDALVIVLVMALAWAIVGVVEWAASRERFGRPLPGPAAPEHAVPLAPEGWAAPEAAEDEADELTVVGAKAAEPEPVPSQRRFWRRHKGEDSEDEPAEAAPRHVRVLPLESDAGEPALDPWEEGAKMPDAAEELPDQEEEAPALAQSAEAKDPD